MKPRKPESDLWQKLEKRKRLGISYVSELHAQGFEDPAKRLANCSSFVQVRHWLESGNHRLIAANWCNQSRICPGCGHASAIRTAVRIAEKSSELLLTNDLVPLLVTFTVKDGPSLTERLSTLLAALSVVRERRNKSGKGKRSHNAWGAIRGAIVRVEIKRGKNSHEWHPHAHALVMGRRGQRFELETMQHDWRKFLGGARDAGNLDVRLTKAGKALVANGGNFSQAIEGELFDDVLEVSKYLVKFGEISPADLAHAYRVTKAKRLAFTWGDYWGVKLEDNPEGDLTDELGPYRDLLARWTHSGYRLAACHPAPMCSGATTEPRLKPAYGPAGP